MTLGSTFPSHNDRIVNPLLNCNPVFIIHVWRVEDESTSVEESSGINGFRLLQNYPNPFNPETKIEYHLTHNADVRLAVYDTYGREVRTLVEGTRQAGNHAEIWNGRDEAGLLVAAGIYFSRLDIRILSGDKRKYSDVKKMVFIK